jgi:enoyl-[acyl-carrier-protein] reductase (NADH)
MIDADDIARASLFLLSDDARMVTGETLVVDAGCIVSA